jgi:cytoskeleton protein RodZ
MGSVLHEGRSKLAKSRNMISTAIDQDGTVALAPRAGADLRSARERVGWSLPDVAAGLHIRLGYLEALEEGRITALPGNAYALGFLRTYATSLGLDPNEITRRFKAEAAAVTEKTELDFPMPVPERGVPAGAVVLLGVVLAVGAYIGWYHLSGEGKLPAETSTQIPTRLAPLAEQAVPPSAPPAAAAAAVPTPATVPTGPMQLVTVDPPPVPAVSPSSAAAAPLPPPVSASADQPRIVLRASADAWVQVRDRSGPVLLNRILHAGDTWDVPAKANLLLTTGNAGGTDLVVDGVTSPSLGGNGAVRRDLPLDPDLIKDGKLAAATTTTTTTQAATPRSTTQ